MIVAREEEYFLKTNKEIKSKKNNVKNSRQSEIKSAPYSESERIRSSGKGICNIGIKKKKLISNLKLKLKK